MCAHPLDDHHDPAIDGFMDTMTRLLAKAALIEKSPVDTGDGVLLYTSEIHLISIAGRFPQESMSAIASRLGITKGAVSQTAKKLEEKGYIERSSGDNDGKTVFIRLTPAGERAFAWHESYHREVNRRLAEAIRAWKPEDRKKMSALLSTLESVFDDCPHLREEITRLCR